MHYSQLPTLHVESGDPAELEVEVLVVAVTTQTDHCEVRAPGLASAHQSALTRAARSVGHTGTADALARVPSPQGVRADSVVLVGVPQTADGSAEATALRSAAGTALRSLTDVESVAVALPSESGDGAEATAVGALLGAYHDTRWKSELSKGAVVGTIVLVAPRSVEVRPERCAVIASAVSKTRDLVNTPPLDLYPESFANAVVAEAAGLPGTVEVEVEVIAEEELSSRGFGGLIGVGSGSPRGPRLVRLAYAPDGAKHHISLVGKGITFDSGGLSLKPALNMEKMKSDMAGAAAVAETLLAIASLELPVRVTAWLALAENLPSGSAMRPADVLCIYGGKTVEVTNTDAEGRLVLADALVAAQEEDPDLIVDVATLTGAQVQALGLRTSGVLGTEGARARVVAASETVGEPMWPMPIPSEMIGHFDSTTADLRNAGGRGGGMLAAAAFLQEFIADRQEWAHLDIAGPAINSEKGYGFTGLGGTGVPVRTLISLIEDASVSDS